MRNYITFGLNAAEITDYIKKRLEIKVIQIEI